MKTLFLITLAVFTAFSGSSQSDPQNGDWKQQFVFKQNTTEADYMIRFGDVDNLGFGWEENFNPFSGISTTFHQYPMQKTDKKEFVGFDLVLLPSSFRKENMARDGYSDNLQYLLDNFKATTFEFKIPRSGIDTSKIKTAVIQIFVDDFQAKEFGTKFEFYLNGKRYAPAEKTLNALRQTGPIGKLITIPVSADRINDLKKDTISIMFDDRTTGIGDGFAIDFIKLLINPKKINKGSLNGTLQDAEGNILSGATVTFENQTVKTAKSGEFKLKDLPAGLVILQVTTATGKQQHVSVDIEANKVTTSEVKLD